MPVLSAAIIARALEETAGQSDPNLRRRAMRQWLDAQGFQKSSIDESDDAILAAIRFDSGFLPSNVSQKRNKASPPQKTNKISIYIRAIFTHLLGAFIFLFTCFVIYIFDFNKYVILSVGTISIILVFFYYVKSALPSEEDGVEEGGNFEAIVGASPMLSLFALGCLLGGMDFVDPRFSYDVGRSVAENETLSAVMEYASREADTSIKDSNPSTRTASNQETTVTSQKQAHESGSPSHQPSFSSGMSFQDIGQIIKHKQMKRKASRKSYTFIRDIRSSDYYKSNPDKCYFSFQTPVYEPQFMEFEALVKRRISRFNQHEKYGQLTYIGLTTITGTALISDDRYLQITDGLTPAVAVFSHNDCAFSLVRSPVGSSYLTRPSFDALFSDKVRHEGWK